MKVLIRRALAMWCLDCDNISELAGGTCPGCGSRELASVARWLDRDRPILQHLKARVGE